MKRHLKAVVALAGAATLAGTFALPAAADTNGVEDPIVNGGSDTTFQIISDLGRLYGGAVGCNQIVVSPAVQPLDGSCVTTAGVPYAPADYTATMKAGNASHDYVVTLPALGSSNGIKQLDKQGQAGIQYVDFARSSRARRLPPGPPTADTLTERWVAFGAEALPWVAFTGQGLPTNLTQTQLTNIYTACDLDGGGNPIQNAGGTWINNWSLVGGPNVPITLYTAQSGSGTRSQFESFLGTTDSTKCMPLATKAAHQIFENDVAPIIAAGEQSSAIFYYSAGRYKENLEKRVFQGNINGVAPTIANVKSFAFPYTRYLWNVYRNTYATANASQATLDFTGVKNPVTGEMGFICKTAAGTVNKSTVDPATGKTYNALMNTIFTAHGMASLAPAATDLHGTLGIPGTSGCRVEN